MADLDAGGQGGSDIGVALATWMADLDASGAVTDGRSKLVGHVTMRGDGGGVARVVGAGEPDLPPANPDDQG
jgi:hypothetical protein